MVGSCLRRAVAASNCQPSVFCIDCRYHLQATTTPIRTTTGLDRPHLDVQEGVRARIASVLSALVYKKISCSEDMFVSEAEAELDDEKSAIKKIMDALDALVTKVEVQTMRWAFAAFCFLLLDVCLLSVLTTAVFISFSSAKEKTPPPPYV